jgi:hypothetical protein
MVAWILLLTLWAAQPAGAQRQIYVSTDGVFRFFYSSNYLPNTKDNADEIQGSYIPVCTDGAVCVVSRHDYFAGTNFQAASFQVREISEAKSRAACLKGPPEDVPQYQLPESEQTKVIGGLTFRHWRSGEVGAGNYLETDFYRVFHNQKCYELSINLATSPFGNFEPGTIKEFRSDDERKVLRELTLALNSFRFLK